MGSKEQLTAAVAVSAVALAASFRAVWSTLRCFANSCNKTSTILHTHFPSQWESLITASSSYSKQTLRKDSCKSDFSSLTLRYAFVLCVSAGSKR